MTKNSAASSGPPDPLPPKGWSVAAIIGWGFLVVGALAAIGSCTVGVASYVYPDWDPIGWKEGWLEALPPVDHDSRTHPLPQLTLVADDAKDWIYQPLGPQSATPVNVEHHCSTSCVIVRAVYTYTMRFPTPHRETKAGKVICLPLNFTKREKPGARNWVKIVDPPISVDKDDWVHVKVAVIDPNQVGWTYRGTLKFYYNGDKVLAVPNVEVDIRANTPKPDKRVDQ